MKFKIIKESKKSQARLTELKTSHGRILGPFFMPIATRGVLKNLTPDELKTLKTQIILANTYHLILRPGIEIIRKAGGLHKFMAWPGPILTDSGGYQIFSLSSKARSKRNQRAESRKSISDKIEEPKINNPEIKITKKGIAFQSEIDGKRFLLTPKKAIEIQIALGSDIIMALDECAPYPCDYKYAKEAMERTTEWAKTGIMNYRSQIRKSQFFGIIQGSIYKDLREQSAREITALDFDGYAIGGVAVGEPREKMWEVLNWTRPYLPRNKPRYLMGLGRPEEIVEAVRKGIDMFDCVIPTRNARHGALYKFQINSEHFSLPFYKILHLTNEKFKRDFGPIDENCGCYTCQHYSRAYLRHLFMLDENLALRLATIHNLNFYLRLMEKIRQRIKEGKL
jgi:queuine tRNA-ribosyltransferase